jgi:hypothetical protein
MLRELLSFYRSKLYFDFLHHSSSVISVAAGSFVAALFRELGATLALL